MINTILFDLDGTLIKLTQEAFISTYFGKLKKVFRNLGLDPELAVKGVWAGTKAMTENDGSRLNIDCFWDVFAGFLNLDADTRRAAEKSCDDFYSGDFDTVKAIIEPSDIPRRLIPALKAKGFTVVLATNPLFPECAVTTRLGWIGLAPQDFALITHYANSSYCKPNPGYFREVLGKINKQPHECIMAGNSTDEDMSAAALGIDTYLVTDCLENEKKTDIRAYKHGTQEEMEEYLLEIPF